MEAMSWSPERPSSLSLHTDKGTFIVSESATLPHPDVNPWFWFRVGESYRVQVHGAGLLGRSQGKKERIVGARALLPSADLAASQP